LTNRHLANDASPATGSSSRTEKVRLDALLVERGLSPSREKAQALILAGLVVVGDHRASKAGQRVAPTAEVRLKGEHCPFVSRGGLKLAAGLEAFGLDPSERVCIDVGASTGGFTDCLLQRGAARVYAVDVGYGQLAWSLRGNPRVIPIERQNIRELPQHAVPEPVDLVVVDASFISLRLVLPKILELLDDRGGDVVALVKPQFEVGKGKVGKGGLVRDPALRRQALEEVSEEARALGFEVGGTLESPVAGAKKGNVEYLLHLRARRRTPGRV
jgi:23S rRNA (cytidine1920-2'-O)/16S rRNA (cytidine1409-2'-O)-methyltransferase